jgi:RNA polymerase I-associated factor PAF67
VTAAHVATYYYVGFCYIMLRRYPDAIRTFVTILNFIMRMKQYHTRSYQYDQVSLVFPLQYSSQLILEQRRSTKPLIGCMHSSRCVMPSLPADWMTTSPTSPKSDSTSNTPKWLAEGTLSFPPFPPPNNTNTT